MRTEDDGLTEAELATLAAIAPRDAWDLAWDDKAREWVTVVTCPVCAERLQYEVGALAEFYCSACEYDWLDQHAPQLPKPASL
ncbi:hypothetical protein D3C72_871760 [compost metagenome]